MKSFTSRLCSWRTKIVLWHKPMVFSQTRSVDPTTTHTTEICSHMEEHLVTRCRVLLAKIFNSNGDHGDRCHHRCKRVVRACPCPQVPLASTGRRAYGTSLVFVCSHSPTTRLLILPCTNDPFSFPHFFHPCLSRCVLSSVCSSIV